jgi:hypothetical protein
MIPVWALARDKQVRHDFKLRHYQLGRTLEKQRQLLYI